MFRHKWRRSCGQPNAINLPFGHGSKATHVILGMVYEIGTAWHCRQLWSNWWGSVGVSKASASFLSALPQVVTSLRRGLSAPWHTFVCSKVPPRSPKAGESFPWKLGFQGFFWWDLGTNAMEKCLRIQPNLRIFVAEESFEIHRGQCLCCWARLAMHPQGQSSRLTGENGEKPKSPTNSAVTQNPCGTVTSFFHFTSGYSRLMYAFWFYWRLLWPILWQMILVKTQICWMAWNLFLLRRGFSVQQSKYGTPNGAILEDHRSHVWRDSLW